MSTKKKPLPAETHKQASNNGRAAELNNEAIHNLTGFFDVLIQMDLTLRQRNEQRNQEYGRRTDDKHSRTDEQLV